MHMLQFLVRYSDFREAMNYLKSNNTTVESRKNAINTVETFIEDLKKGVFDSVFIGVK